MEECSLREILTAHTHTNIREDKDDCSGQRIPVRRKVIWKDTMRCLKSPNFTCDRGLMVRFIAEEAVDAGGPLREFFQLLMKVIGMNWALLWPQ